MAFTQHILPSDNVPVFLSLSASPETGVPTFPENHCSDYAGSGFHVDSIFLTSHILSQTFSEKRCPSGTYCFHSFYQNIRYIRTQTDPLSAKTDRSGSFYSSLAGLCSCRPENAVITGRQAPVRPHCRCPLIFTVNSLRPGC